MSFRLKRRCESLIRPFAPLLLSAMAAGVLAASGVANTALPAKESIPVTVLTLAQAESIALRHSPEIGAAYFDAQAAGQRIREERSAFFPQVNAEVAAVGVGNDIENAFGGSHTAANDTRLGSNGGLNSPTVLDRQSNGVTITQLIIDFGRTGNLTAMARFQALSAQHKAALARARVILNVDEAYFRALGAESLLQVASENVAARQTVFDQVSALQQSGLKSNLDRSFAQVAIGEAKLLELQARNSRDEAFAAISAALGYRARHDFKLAEEPQSALPPEPLPVLIAQALEYRPEALALRAETDGAKKFAAAEMEARYPKVSALGTVGRTTDGDPRAEGNYSAAGVIIDLPAFTGGRLSARYAEALLRAKAAQKDLEAEEDQIVKGVNDAWLDAAGALERIPVTREILTSAREALQLAQSRYQLGTTSIVELSQAQLSAIQAEIGNATAKYDYQVARARLEFETGALKYRTPIPNTR